MDYYETSDVGAISSSRPEPLRRSLTAMANCRPSSAAQTTRSSATVGQFDYSFSDCQGHLYEPASYGPSRVPTSRSEPASSPGLASLSSPSGTTVDTVRT